MHFIFWHWNGMAAALILLGLGLIRHGLIRFRARKDLTQSHPSLTVSPSAVMKNYWAEHLPGLRYGRGNSSGSFNSKEHVLYGDALPATQHVTTENRGFAATKEEIWKINKHMN